MITRALQISGWMSPLELKWLASAAQESSKIVEFGSHHGRSTRALADNCPGFVYAVDPWDGKYFDNDDNPLKILKGKAWEKFNSNLKDHIESGKVTPFRCFSWEVPIESADFVFIDGDHRYDSVRRDIITAQRLVKKGIIAGHDYLHPDWPGVKKAVDEVFPKIELVDTIWYLKF